MNIAKNLLLISVLFLAWGCRTRGPALSPGAQQQLNQALLAYRAGDDQKTLACTNFVLMESKKGYGAMQAYYLRGLARLRKGQLNTSALDLRHVYSRAPYDSLRLKAADALGEVLFKQGKMQEAATLLQEVLSETLPRQKLRDHASYRLGCILQREGRWSESRKHFRRVMYEYRKSGLANLAEQRSVASAWTIQVGAYSSRQQALDSSSVYTSLGHKIYVAEDIHKGTQLVYLLLVGRWNSYRQARASLPAIKQIESGAFLKVTR